MPKGKYIRTPAMIENYRRGAQNRQYTEEGRAKRRESLAKRPNPPALGKRWKSKTKRKSHAGMLGKKHSEETKLKISSNTKGRVPWNKNKTVSPMERERLKSIGLQGLIKQQTTGFKSSIETKVQNLLIQLNIIFFPQCLIHNKFLVDFYIPEADLIIECDGNYWHSLDEVKKRDKTKNAYLTTCDFQLLRLSETEINNEEFIDKILTKLNFLCNN